MKMQTRTDYYKSRWLATPKKVEKSVGNDKPTITWEVV